MIKHVFASKQQPSLFTRQVINKQSKRKAKDMEKSRLTPNMYSPLIQTCLDNRHMAIIHSGKKETRRTEEKEAEVSVGTTPPLHHATTRG